MSVSVIGISALIAGELGLPTSLEDLFNSVPQGNIGGIPIQVTLEEIANDTLQVTEHPVEAGAAITDHSFLKPAEIILHCGWSNSTASSALGAISTLLTGGSSFASDTVGAIYSQLRALQMKRATLTVTSSLRTYTSMLIVALAMTRDQKSSQALMVNATLRQVIIVATQSAKLAPQANQANPASTAETSNVGPQALIPSTTSITSLPKGAQDSSGFNAFGVIP